VSGKRSGPQGNDSNNTAKQAGSKKGAGAHDGKTASAHPGKSAPAHPGKTTPAHHGNSSSLVSSAVKSLAPTPTAALPLKHAHGVHGTQNDRQPLHGQHNQQSPVPTARPIPVPKQTQQPNMKTAQLQQTQPTRQAQQGAKVLPIQKKPSGPANQKTTKPTPSSQQR
jgi:hypothetical protein